MRRGIYRLVHFPAGPDAELVETWLWTAQAATFSHQTALALHGLSDVLPARIHVTLPEAWRGRRLRVPKPVTVHHAGLTKAECSWVGAVPVTAIPRTLNDCARADFSPELLKQATDQALTRGLVRKSELQDVRKALAKFGGLPK